MGAERLHRRMQQVPQKIITEVAAQMEKEAARIVATMQTLKPLPNIQIGWTWGDAPKGTVSVGTVHSGRNRGKAYERLAITIYASAEVGGRPFPGVAGWFEFGTGDRYHKSGKYVGRIQASPYFFPAWRAGKKAALSGMKRAVSRAVKKA